MDLSSIFSAVDKRLHCDFLAYQFPSEYKERICSPIHPLEPNSVLIDTFSEGDKTIMTKQGRQVIISP